VSEWKSKVGSNTSVGWPARGPADPNFYFRCATVMVAPALAAMVGAVDAHRFWRDADLFAITWRAVSATPPDPRPSAVPRHRPRYLKGGGLDEPVRTNRPFSPQIGYCGVSMALLLSVGTLAGYPCGSGTGTKRCAALYLRPNCSSTRKASHANPDSNQLRTYRPIEHEVGGWRDVNTTSPGVALPSSRRVRSTAMVPSIASTFG